MNEFLQIFLIGVITVLSLVLGRILHQVGGQKK